jgi:hypothetical protein
MIYSETQIQKSINCTCKSKKYRIDMLLEMDAIQYCNLGKDSTKDEKLEVKKRSKNIYKAISKIDFVLGKSLLQLQDK